MKPPRCWVSFPSKPSHPSKMGLLYGSSDGPKTVLFLKVVVLSGNKMHNQLQDTTRWRCWRVKPKRGEASVIKPGGMAVDQILRRERRSPGDYELPQTGQKQTKEKTRNQKQSQRTLGGTGSQTRNTVESWCWCCRQMPATRSPEEKPATEVRR